MDLSHLQLTPCHLRWLDFALDSEIPVDDEVFTEFLLKDHIDCYKFIENHKANEIVYSYSSLDIWERTNALSLDESVHKLAINCTPSFRMYFCRQGENRGAGVPDWFYIAYPDIAIWMEANSDTLEILFDDIEEVAAHGKFINPWFFRAIIEIYKQVTKLRLECEL